MGDPEERENLFHTLSTRLLSQNLDVLCSILNRLFMEGRASSILGPDLQLLVLEEEELYIDPVPRASIGKSMARTPYVTVRGPEPAPPAPKPQETVMPQYDEAVENPQEEVEEDTGPSPPEAVEFDVDRVSALLEAAVRIKDFPNLAVLNGEIQKELAKIAKEAQEEVTKRQEEYQEAMAEWENKKKAEAEAKRKEEKEKEDA